MNIEDLANKLSVTEKLLEQSDYCNSGLRQELVQ